MKIILRISNKVGWCSLRRISLDNQIERGIFRREIQLDEYHSIILYHVWKVVH